MKNKIKFAEFMAGMSEIFDKEVTPKLSEIYWKVFKPFTDDECESAFNVIMTTSKFWPKPADFLDVLQGTPEDRSIDGWSQVIDDLKKYHPDFPNQKPDLPPEIEHAINHLGGLDALSRMSYDELKWQEKRFREVFKSITDRVLIDDGGERKLLN